MVFSWHRLHSLCHHILCMAFFPPKQLMIPVRALDVKCLSNVHVFSDFPSLLQATRGEKQHTQCIRLQEQFIVCKQGKHFHQVLPTIQRQPGSLRQTPVPGASAASPLRCRAPAQVCQEMLAHFHQSMVLQPVTMVTPGMFSLLPSRPQYLLCHCHFLWLLLA